MYWHSIHYVRQFISRTIISKDLTKSVKRCLEEFSGAGVMELFVLKSTCSWLLVLVSAPAAWGSRSTRSVSSLPTDQLDCWRMQTAYTRQC